LAGGLNTYGYVGGNPTKWSDPLGLLDVTGNHINIGGINKYQFETKFYHDSVLSRYGRDIGRSGNKIVDRIAKAFGALQDPTGVSDVPITNRKGRKQCDRFDATAAEVYEEMFGKREKIDADELRRYIEELETYEGYPSHLYPPAAEFVERAKQRAWSAPKDWLNR